MVWILGRTQVNSPEDGSTTVKGIQDGYRLTPLSKWGTSYAPKKTLLTSRLARPRLQNKLSYNKDGSPDLYIKKDDSGRDKEANWLPASPDKFSLTMRIYWPKDEFLNGSWKIPGVKPI